MSDLTWTNSTRRLSDLVPWEKNPRQIKDAGAKRLVESMDQFGQIHAIAIGPGDEIYDGHQRSFVWAACERYGPDFEVDVRVASRPLTEPEREKLVIFLHSGATGSYDWEILSAWDSTTLKSWGLDEGQLRGWNDDAANLALMLEAEEDEPPEDPGAQVDRAEELREKWGVNLGDLWKCGEHLIICGDCTDAAVVERVMGGEKAEMVWTDPPYGVSYGAKNRYLQTIGPSDRLEDDIEGDDLLPDEVGTLTTDALSAMAAHCLPGAVAYVAAPPGPLHIRFITAMNESGFQYRHQLIWLKNQLVFGRSDYMYKHEPILYGWLQNGAHFFEPRSNNCTVFEFDRPRESKLHPTMKPVELVAAMIENSSNPEDCVADPFSGSGTTGIACERLGRKARLIEIDPKYVAVTLERWAEMTNGTPELMG